MRTIRWLLPAAALAAAAVLITFHPHGARFAIGTWPVPAGTPWTYQLESGFIPALTVLSLATLIAGAWHRVSCHRDGCARIGRFPVAGGLYKVCRKDHPDPAVRGGLQPHHLLAAHEAHLRHRDAAP
jgi:hypothetical protein